MDSDMLMAMLGDILQRLSSMELDVSSIKTWMPGEPDNTMIEAKLDRIIELLEQLIEET